LLYAMVCLCFFFFFLCSVLLFRSSSFHMLCLFLTPSHSSFSLRLFSLSLSFSNGTTQVVEEKAN
jgi:hypothetical protein